MILIIAATALALAFVLTQRYKAGILGPLMLPAILAALAVGVYSHSSLVALIASALLVSLCINLGYWSGLAFSAAVAHRKEDLPPTADNQGQGVRTSPPPPSMGDSVPV
jgi:hypothetical protein